MTFPETPCIMYLQTEKRETKMNQSELLGLLIETLERQESFGNLNTRDKRHLKLAIDFQADIDESLKRKVK